MSTGEAAANDGSIHPFVYYQKPVIGADTAEDVVPIQTVFPSGGFAIGVPVKFSDAAVATEERDSLGIIASAPLNHGIDVHQKQTLAFAFLAVALVNLVVTILMFSRATEVDLSKVEPGRGPLPTIFEKLSSTRTEIQSVNYGCILFIILLGSGAVLTENALGLSMYALAVAVNFFLGTYSLPYFLYSFRYLLDFAMLYLALLLRSRLTYTYLPIHLHRQ